MTKSKLDRSGSRAPLFLKLVTPQLITKKNNLLKPAKRNVFILSTGRTGTVSLPYLLDQLDGITATYEPRPSRILNAWTSAYLEGKIPERSMTQAFYNKRHHTLESTDDKIYVETNNFIAGFAGAITEVVEDALIIHIVRDPRDFITSMTNRGDDTGIRKFFNKYVPYWAYVPKGMKKRELTRYTRLAYRWVAINNYLSDWGKNHPDKYRFFKFEDLFDRAKPEKLHPLLEAIGLSKSDINRLDFGASQPFKKRRFNLLDQPVDTKNTSVKQAMAKWTDWSAADKRAVEEICGPLMRRYGYGGESAWKKATR